MNDRRNNERILPTMNERLYSIQYKKHYPCHIRNLSVTGACVSIMDASPKDLGETVYLCLSGDDKLKLKSKIIWYHDETVGLEFSLDTSRDFEAVSYIMNSIAPLYNK